MALSPADGLSDVLKLLVGVAVAVAAGVIAAIRKGESEILRIVRPMVHEELETAFKIHAEDEWAHRPVRHSINQQLQVALTAAEKARHLVEELERRVRDLEEKR